MITLLVAVFAASVVGSLHCAGMCGGIVALCSRRGASVFDQLGYHGSRGLTYTLVGALAGGLGGALDLGGRLLGLQRAVACVAGVGLIAVGLLALWRFAGGRSPRLFSKLAPRLQARVSGAVAAGADLPPRTYAALLGLLTPLLPCGWLYVFALAAAGTANPLLGAAVMAVFWLGTVPILFALALGLQAATNRLRKAAPVVGGVVMIGVGVLLVVERGQLEYSLTAPQPSAAAGEPVVPRQAPCCEESSTAAEVPAQRAESTAVEGIVIPTQAPCCAEPSTPSVSPARRAESSPSTQGPPATEATNAPPTATEAPPRAAHSAAEKSS